jgi:hypothetical protein
LNSIGPGGSSPPVSAPASKLVAPSLISSLLQPSPTTATNTQAAPM